VSGGTTAPHKYRDLVLQVWELDAGLTALFCKKKLLLRNTEKSVCTLAESCKEGRGSKWGCFSDDEDDDDDDDDSTF
jgi:hypothetical protein